MFVLGVTSAHWWTPRGDGLPHMAHVALRKLYILPVVLAAIWFDLRGSLLTAALSSMLYMPHVILQWHGQASENVNQVGELGTLWVTALLSGIFAKHEKAALREIASAYQGTVRALVRALDVREHDTEQHSLRVQAYTLRLAKELRVDPERRRLYGLAALLHDIGKIGIPDAILLKPDKLSEPEWEQMRKHSELGGRILPAVPFFRDVAQIVRAHHEKFDGTGYPHGLAGKDIPRGARIFAVADVFDALTSARPYKQPFTYEEARSTIQEESASHFDPEAVEAFLRVPHQEWDHIRRAVAHDGADRG